MSKWILTGSLVGLVLIIVALVVGYVVVPPLIIERVIENVRLVKGTDQYGRWVEVPQPLDFKVYIFNVTNVDEIQRGLQPKVEEIGPYVYTQTRKKYNIRFTRDEERVSYYSQMTFQFNKEKSGQYSEDDKIVVLNMHMNSILQIIDKETRRMVSNVTRGVERTIDNIPVINLIKRMLDRYTPLQSILQTVESETPFLMEFVNNEINNIFGPTRSFFIETTPRKFLFEGVNFCGNATGIAGLVCTSVEDRQSPSIIRSPAGDSLMFSMFNHKNRTHDGLYEINTGIRRLERLLRIERWKNSRSLRHWNSDRNRAPSTCQFINGTDATLAPPFREINDDFYIFASDICRSVHLVYDYKTEYNGIAAYRYSTRDDFLNSMEKCFCINKINGSLVEEDGCLYSGALDLTECLDAPIVATMPHFLEADRRYGLLVDGMFPNMEKHSVSIDVEPFTGTPVRGGKKLQFNMFLRRIDRITLSQNFKKPRLFPVLWVDEGIELNDEMSDLLKGDLTNVLILINVIQWTVFGIGVLMFIGFLVWFFIARRKMKNSVSVEPIYPATTVPTEGANNSS